MKRDRLIRDPVYDYISLPAELAAIVDHPLYQRLRRVSQTSMTSLVYPSATGTRFEHGLGAMQLGRDAWRAAWRNAPVHAQDMFIEATHAHSPKIPVTRDSVGEYFALVVAVVGLLHDVGHPPFSHVLEGEYQRMLPDHLEHQDALLEEWRAFGSPMHEFAGMVLTRRLVGHLPKSLSDVARDVYEADPDDGSWSGAVHSVVAGEIDVDRLDYLMRDAQKAGTEFGAIDFVRLIDSLELHHDGAKFRVAPGVRGRSAVETLLAQRSQSYRWITYHHRVVGSNLALSRAVSQVQSLCRSDDIVRVGETEQPLSRWFSSHVPNLNYLAPRLSDVTAALRPDDSGAVQQLPFDDQLQADWIASAIDEVAAAVDDSAIIEWLQRTMLLTRVLLNRGQLTDAVRSRLLDFVTYTEASLLRSKNFMPTWKTVEEFAGAAREMAPSLVNAVETVFAGLLERFGGEPIEESLRDQQTHLLAALERDAVAGTNRLFGLTASGMSQREMLRVRLQKQRHNLLDVEGFWDLEYASFRPVRTAGNMTVLYRGEEAYTLVEHSPLVRSLEDIERYRPKLFALFFIRSPLKFPKFAADAVREARIMLSGEFIAAFPDHVRDHLAESIIDTTPKEGISG